MKIPSEVIGLISKGKVGLLPSDTIYGLSCSAMDENAVQKIYRLKGRDYSKPLIILLADTNQARLIGLDPGKFTPVIKYWPGPLTVIVPSGRQTPEYLHRGTSTLAVRVPDNEVLQNLISQTGPIVSTSANPQGKRPARSVKEAKDYFGNELDFYLDTGESKAKHSTIVELMDGKLKLIRQGAYKVPG